MNNEPSEARAYFVLHVRPDGYMSAGIFSEENPTAVQPSRNIVLASAKGSCYRDAVNALYRYLVHDPTLHPWLPLLKER